MLTERGNNICDFLSRELVKEQEKKHLLEDAEVDDFVRRVMEDMESNFGLDVSIHLLDVSCTRLPLEDRKIRGLALQLGVKFDDLNDELRTMPGHAPGYFRLTIVGRDLLKVLTAASKPSSGKRLG